MVCCTVWRIYRSAVVQTCFDLQRHSTPCFRCQTIEARHMHTCATWQVSKDVRGGWTARVGDTIGDRGKCEGQNIPPLECVIETRWPGVKVNWNGHDPIL